MKTSPAWPVRAFPPEIDTSLPTIARTNVCMYKLHAFYILGKTKRRKVISGPFINATQGTSIRLRPASHLHTSYRRTIVRHVRRLFIITILGLNVVLLRESQVAEKLGVHLWTWKRRNGYGKVKVKSDRRMRKSTRARWLQRQQEIKMKGKYHLRL